MHGCYDGYVWHVFFITHHVILIDFLLYLKKIIVYVGAHSLGRARQQNSEFDGAWVRNTNRLDNAFFRDIRDDAWRQEFNANQQYFWVRQICSSDLTLSSYSINSW